MKESKLCWGEHASVTSNLTQSSMYSFCHTHLVTWLARFSRRALISRQTLRTQGSQTRSSEDFFSTHWGLILFHTATSSHVYCIKVSVHSVFFATFSHLITNQKTITHLESIYTRRSLLSSVSCDTLWEETIIVSVICDGSKRNATNGTKEKSGTYEWARGASRANFSIFPRRTLKTKWQLTNLPISHGHGGHRNAWFPEGVRGF